jgi:hypothetical protein
MLQERAEGKSQVWETIKIQKIEDCVNILWSQIMGTIFFVLVNI